MEDERSVGQPLDAEAAEDEYELDPEDTEDLDLAMREALEAVEREEGRFDAVAGDEGRRAAAESNGDFARLQAELADLRDRSVRTLADFDNYRKRVARERREEQRYAVFELVREILSVIDNLERALGAEGSAEDLKVGVEMTHRQLLDLLRQYGVSRVAAVGEPFDPAVHEAVARFEDEGVSQPTVSDQMQSGYLLHDRLLRPAMVRVALPVEEPNDLDEADESAQADEADESAPERETE